VFVHLDCGALWLLLKCTRYKHSYSLTRHLLITCILTEEMHFEIEHFHNFFTYDRVIQIPLCSTHGPLPTQQISFKSGKTFCGGMDRHMDTATGFIRSTRQLGPPSQRNNNMAYLFDFFTQLIWVATLRCKLVGIDLRRSSSWVRSSAI